MFVLFWRISACHMSCVTCHLSHVMCHMSCFTCHASHVTYHVSHVTCHLSHVTFHVSCVMCHVSLVTCHVSHITCHMLCVFFGQNVKSAEGLLSTWPIPSFFCVFIFLFIFYFTKQLILKTRRGMPR